MRTFKDVQEELDFINKAIDELIMRKRELTAERSIVEAREKLDAMNPDQVAAIKAALSE